MLKRKIGTIIMSCLLIMLPFMPVVSAQSVQSTGIDGPKVGTVITVNTPDLRIIENTNTSTIFFVGNYLVTLKSNTQHTEANLTVDDTISHSIVKADYHISRDASGIYTTRIFQEGKLISISTSEYDPLELNFGEKRLLNDNKKVPLQTYTWDGVTYVQKGFGVKYSHPDYTTYSINDWDNVKIQGGKLSHWHAPKWFSTTIGPLSAVAAAIAIVAFIGLTDGVGTPIALAAANYIISAGGVAYLQDEKGCIWMLISKDTELKMFFLPPSPGPIWVPVPKYFRIAEGTLWDDMSMGNPS